MPHNFCFQRNHCGSGRSTVIQLTRLNNNPLVLNSDLIKFVEQAPDTVITLVSGEKIVVREAAENVRERVILFRRAVLQGTLLVSTSGLGSPARPDPADARTNNDRTANDGTSDHSSDATGDPTHGRPNPRHAHKE